jgi:hypothetical protein
VNRAQTFRIAPEKKQRGYPAHSGYPRVLHEYYREPGRTIDALLRKETFTGSVFDPFCGGGTIPARCRAYGIDADGSDLQSIEGCTVQDFFTSTAVHDNIISNPPYIQAEQAIHHGLPLIRYKMALLLRLNFLASQKRSSWLYHKVGLARVLVLGTRPSCPPGIYTGIRDNYGCLVQPEETGGKADYAWLVFWRGYTGKVLIEGIG